MHRLANAIATLSLLAPDLALAHDGSAHGPLAPRLVILIAIAVMAAGYGYGVMRPRRRGSYRVRPWQIACVAVGLALLALALVWPLDGLTERSFAAHMGQHMVLIALAPPLLVLGAPLALFARFAPLRRALTYVPWRWLARPSTAFALHAFVVWGWHAPRLFQAAVRSDMLHLLEHVTLLATALLFWWSLLHPARARASGYGASAVLLLLTMMHTGLLGALLTFAPRPLYPVYGAAASAVGLTPLEDQQLAGLIMWVAGGMFYLLAGLMFAAAWLRDAERRAGWGGVLQSRRT